MTSTLVSKAFCGSSTRLSIRQAFRPTICQQSRYFSLAGCRQVRENHDLPPAPRPHPLPYEHGVTLTHHRKPLSRRYLSLIYRSPNIDGKQGLRLLQVLQGRRIDGTLDVPLPPDLARLAAHDRRLVIAALTFLRSNYPVDEEAAILHRIRDEEREQRLSDQERFRPQSGYFGVKRGENDSIWGRSGLEEIRKRNEENQKLERQAEDQMIDQLDSKYKQEGKPGGLVRAQDQDMSVGRPLTVEDVKNNVYLRWKLLHSMQAQSKVTAEQAEQMTMSRRLLPSAAFTTLFLLGMYWFSQSWSEPNRIDRIWPNVPIAAATVFTIILANVGIFALWKMWPPAWKYLNKYFMSTPGWPTAFSMLGNTVSHQQFSHLAVNMLCIWWIGLRLHEDVGRGNFLALYLASGVFASFAGLTVLTLRKIFYTFSQGASGSITGIVGAYFTIHSE